MPRAVIGAPIYNNAGHLREALESLLSQTFKAFVVVVSDDASTDDTRRIIDEYVAIDSRMVYRRNTARLGLVGNWRRAYEHARELYPDSRYFAWASDHDIWHPRWLEHLIEALDARETAVLAYPLSVFVDEKRGALVRPSRRRNFGLKPSSFETVDYHDALHRLRATCAGMSAGNMVYGLFRVEALEKAGVMRRVLLPDRLLLAELALYGEFKQVPVALWCRRLKGGRFSLSRQRAVLFQGTPLHAYLPWWALHAATLGWQLGVRGSGKPRVGRPQGLIVAFEYLRTTLRLQLTKAIRLRSKRVRRTWTRLHSSAKGFALGTAGHLRRRLGALVRRSDRVMLMSRLMRRAISGVAVAGREARAGDRRRHGVLRLMLRVAALAVDALPPLRDRIIPLIKQEIGQVVGAGATRDVDRELKRVLASSKPVIVGPWLSEVGFELLYWIPFLNWISARFDVGRDRLIFVSRGGAEPWYRHLGGRYKDVLDFIPIEEFRRRNEGRWASRGGQKQLEIEPFDADIIARVRRQLDLGEVEILHPSLMYRLFRFYWQDMSAVHLLKNRTHYRRLEPAEQAPVATNLPADFVAVRFYFRPSFPETEENRAFIRRLLSRLAANHDVVLLNTGLRADDHCDYEVEPGKRIHTIADVVTPRNNLAVQSEVIGRARAFVGTYGGLSYLGPFCGVPAFGFYSDITQFIPAHLEVANRVFRALETFFFALHTRDTEVLDMLAGVGRRD